jgi:hypothetical protein
LINCAAYAKNSDVRQLPGFWSNVFKLAHYEGQSVTGTDAIKDKCDHDKDGRIKTVPVRVEANCIYLKYRD